MFVVVEGGAGGAAARRSGAALRRRGGELAPPHFLFFPGSVLAPAETSHRDGQTLKYRQRRLAGRIVVKAILTLTTKKTSLKPNHQNDESKTSLKTDAVFGRETTLWYALIKNAEISMV